MIQENQSQSRVDLRGADDLKKISSQFHSGWLSIQNKVEEEKKIHEDELAKANKGRAPSAQNKVNKTDMNELKNHKYILAAFFERMKDEFKDEKHVSDTYKGTETPPMKIQMSDLKNLTLDDPAYKQLPAESRMEIEQYGEALKAAYLKNGLSVEEVKLRQKADGKNQLPEKEKVPAIVKFIIELTNVFSLLLFFGAVLSFIGYGLDTTDQSNLWLAIVLLVVQIVSALCAFLQGASSDSMMESLKSLQTSEVTAIRGGEEFKINIVDLVKGDVVIIRTGEKIPADCRIFQSSNLQVDNSPLTGETKPIKIGPEPGEKGLHDTLEALNVVFFSTLCKDGEGYGVVTDIGMNTFMGKIADLASSGEEEKTTLQRELDAFIALIAILACSLGVLFFVLGIIISYPIITDFIFAIGIIVANVPEGLGYAVTSILALVALKMLKRKVFVKNLQSVETLGSITCICSDKTGTLTQNKMMVVHLWYDMQIKKTKENQVPIRIDDNDVEMKMFHDVDSSFEIMKFVAVCGSQENFVTEIPDSYPPYAEKKNELEKKYKNNPDMLKTALGEVKQQLKKEYETYYAENINERPTNPGNASETAMVKFFEHTETIDQTRNRYPLHTSQGQGIYIPFNSTLKFSCFLRRVYDQPDGKYTIQIAFKGAPEQLIKRCTRYLNNGVEEKIHSDFNKEFKFANNAFALKGERVIGLAYSRLDPTKYNDSYAFSTKSAETGDFAPNFPIDDLCFVGLIAMEDPPRPGVKEAIQTCHEAGVKVIMVTGDQPLTAASIAYQIGIIKNLDDTPEIIQQKEGLATLEEAEKKSNTIIITGDRIQKALKEEESLSDDNPKKGAILRSWIMKRDVVFARTTPQHKYAIVEACQSLSHCVAVTGDGVNDSPAMKKADIGVAMGKIGTEVAKDAADILLLDDNFANIVRGIKQGRVVFDILKKIIRYNLSSNFCELIPFIGFVILQFPLPLTTLQLLVMDVGTNIYPNICFAYETAEDSIMKRKPRNFKTDRLCPLTLLGYSYIFIGSIQCAAIFLMYFVAANDYGIKPSTMFYLVNKNGIAHAQNDIFNPYDFAFKGNSNAFTREYAQILSLNSQAYTLLVDSKYRTLDYTSDNDKQMDMRLFYNDLPLSSWSTCKYDSIGQDFDTPICYKMEAIRHAQGAYLLGHIIMQIINGISSRVKMSTVFKHLFKNHYFNSGYFIEIAIIILVIYVPGLNTAFQVRPLIFQHWIPCLGMFIIFLFYDEFTRFLIRNVKNPDGSPGFFFEYFNY